MAARPPPAGLRVLFFDVFGTCVAQMPPLGDALWKAAKEALQSDATTSSINSDVRRKATDMEYDDWFKLGGEWNLDVDEFVSESIKNTGNVDWKEVDGYRFTSLCKLLARRGLVMRHEDYNDNDVKQGSLWTKPQLQELVLVWRRLPPWPDTNRGLELLNKEFTTVTLSNTYNELMTSLVSHSNIPFQHVYTSDLFGSYKPNPKVYLGAAEKLGVKPEECALVAAHLGDLKGAKACGFYTIYVERELEEKKPELKSEGIQDLTVGLDEEGFVALAQKLGISSSS